MFRTKSLTTDKFIELAKKKQRQNQCAQNPLRGLIADKTTRYYQHMERIALQDNHLYYTTSASKRHIIENQQKKPQILTKVQINQFSVIQEKQNRKEFVNDQSPINKMIFQQAIVTPKLTQESRQIYMFPDQCDGQQSGQFDLKKKYEDQIELLRSQQTLKNTQLEELLKKLAINTEKIEELQIKLKQKDRKLTQCNQFTISISPEVKIQEHAQSMTDLSSKDITYLTLQSLQFKQQLKAKQEELNKALKFLNEIFKQDQQSLDIADIDQIANQQHSKPQIQHKNMHNSLLFKLEKYYKKNKTVLKNQVELFKEVNKQMKKNYEQKILYLVNLLGQAQEEIKKLLGKLRETKENEITQYRKHTSKRKQVNPLISEIIQNS